MQRVCERSKRPAPAPAAYSARRLAGCAARQEQSGPPRGGPLTPLEDPLRARLGPGVLATRLRTALGEAETVGMMPPRTGIGLVQQAQARHPDLEAWVRSWQE